MNLADRLIENTIRTRNPSVIGLDPDIGKIPACYRAYAQSSHPLEAVAEVIAAFNRDIIDTVADLVPAVKPQMAFYEKYGCFGVAAFEKTVAYAREHGLVVIEDAKRNDIGNTAQAYADGHLGEVALLDGRRAPAMDADFLTVTPFLGSESLRPFITACHRHNKGVFVLVKTSNPGSGEIQDVTATDGLTISQHLARFVAAEAEAFVGEHGYSPIGAVVGATYPEEAAALRQLMPRSCFLVPGYGAQGGSAKDILPCFQPDGLGAIVNASRAILYAHMTDAERARCTREEYRQAVRRAAMQMQRDIHTALRQTYPQMIY